MAISDLHMCGVTQDGKLWHTLRSMQGTIASWSPWEQVKGPGPFINIDCVRVAQPGSQGNDNPPLEFHILGVTQDGKLWHTVSTVAHQWHSFEDFGARIGGSWGAFQRVRAAQLHGKLHVCPIVLTAQGQRRILHTVRDTNGNWSSFEDATQPELASFPGSFVNVDCTGLWDSTEELHVCGVTDDGKLWHTINCDNPPWLPFINVQVMSSNIPSSISTVSIAIPSEMLHVCVQAHGDLWHTTRSSDIPPSWQPAFDAIKNKAGNPGAFGSISCADIGGELHLCGNTSDGKIWHTRFSSAANASGWQPFESVKAGNNPGPMDHISITGEPPATGPQGEDPHCAPIQIQIGNDISAMQGLQTQLASTTNSASINQLNVQIAGLRQAIAVLQQQAQQYNCPGSF
jgi:hypothetical protein